MNDAEQTTPAKPELVEVTSLDQFAAMVATWHEQKKLQLAHLAQVPDGASFTIGDGSDAKTIVLTGEVLTGFKFGVELSLMAVGSLPFVAQTEDAEAPA